jgi:hypothetical protein
VDDKFLNEARREPRPEFAASLRTQLSREESERVEKRRFIVRPSLALAAGVVVAAVGALIAFPSVRGSAEAFLDLFRVRNFTAVEFDPARLDKLKSLDHDNQYMVFDHQEETQKESAPQVYPTIEAAGIAAGLAVRQPSYVPGGFAMDTVMVESQAEARFSVNEPKLRGLLDALDLRDVEIPAGLNGQTVTVHKPPVVIEQFKRGSSRMILIQAKSPEVSLPPGVDLARLGEIGLRILGLDASEAHRISQSIDWHSTLVIPVPLNASSFRRITVHGNPGLLVTTRGDMNTMKQRFREGTVLLWTESDRVFALIRSYGGADTELVQVAESLR